MNNIEPKIKLLYVVRHLQPGGISNVLINRLNFLSKTQQFNITILTELENNADIISRFDPKITISQLDVISRKNIFLKHNEYSKVLKKAIEFFNPDIISDYDWGLYTKVIPKLKNRFKIKEYHGSYSGKKKLNKRRKSYLLDSWNDFNYIKRNNKYDLSVTLTNGDLKDRKYLTTDKIAIPNGINTNISPTPYSEREKIIIGVGALTHYKNFISLLKVWNQIHQKFSDWKIEIYGNGIQKKELEEYIFSAGMEDSVRLMGFEPKMETVYNKSSILVSTSLSEGFGMNILEAQTYGIPVLAYNCKHGPADIIQNKQSGYLIQLNNHEQLKVHLVRLLKNLDLRIQFSENAINYSKQFSNENVNELWLNLYKKIFNDKILLSKKH